MDQYEILFVKYRCPKCGREYEEEGKTLKTSLGASYIECPCGFEGELMRC